MLKQPMKLEGSKTINIARSYVLKSMLLATIAASLVPLGLLFLLIRLEGEMFFLVLFIIVTNLMLVGYLIASTYKKATTQSIRFYKDKIVFNQIALGRTFEFGNDRNWTVVEKKWVWVLSSSKTGFLKKIPKSAFPLFKKEIEHFYLFNKKGVSKRTHILTAPLKQKSTQHVNVHTPNHIPASERIQNTVFSILLFAYGTYGVAVNDLYIPGKRSKGIHLHDVPAWIMYGAIICACLVMLSVVVDHYDKRNNETNYRLFANVFKYSGWGFFGLSLVMAIIR